MVVGKARPSATTSEVKPGWLNAGLLTSSEYLSTGPSVDWAKTKEGCNDNEYDVGRMLESCRAKNDNVIAKLNAIIVGIRNDILLPLILLLLLINLTNFFVLFRSYNDFGNLFSLDTYQAQIRQFKGGEHIKIANIPCDRDGHELHNIDYDMG